MHKFTRHQVQLLSYLKGGYLCRTIDVPTAQEKSEQIFFAQPKAHQNKYTNLNKTVPTDPLKMIAFFKQCQATQRTRWLAFLRRSPRISSQRKGKRLNFLLHVAKNQATVNISVVNIATTIEATNVATMIDHQTIVIKTIGATIALDATIRT